MQTSHVCRVGSIPAGSTTFLSFFFLRPRSVTVARATEDRKDLVQLQARPFSLLSFSVYGAVVYGLASGALVARNQVRVLAVPSPLGAKVAHLVVAEETSGQYR